MPCTSNFAQLVQAALKTVTSGGIVADYGTDGLLAGLEILDASLLLGKDDLDRVILELSPARKMAALQD